ncbi:MAG: YcgJ family protein [Henriciella sp.]
MRRAFFLTLLCSIACSLLISSTQDSAPHRERKAGEVFATGYVDLIPPTNYSPFRGVVCESLGTKNGALTGVCYDREGASVEWTRCFISDEAARILESQLSSSNSARPDVFVMGSKIACSTQNEICRSTELKEFPYGEVMPAHTKAIFGFPDSDSDTTSQCD